MMDKPGIPIASVTEILAELDSPSFTTDNAQYLVGVYIGGVYETPRGRRITGLNLRDETARKLIEAAQEQGEDPQVLIGWVLDHAARGDLVLRDLGDAEK